VTSAAASAARTPAITSASAALPKDNVIPDTALQAGLCTRGELVGQSGYELKILREHDNPLPRPGGASVGRGLR
jgi:hypothetical protein